MHFHKNNLIMTFKLKINPNLLAQQAFQTVDTIQKLNFEFYFLRSKTILEYVVESCYNNNYQLFDIQSKKALDNKEKIFLLEMIFDKILFQKEELSISSYQKPLWLNVLNNICYCGLLGILQKYQKQFHNYLDSGIEIQFENKKDKSHNLLKSAFQGMNLYLAHWLVKNYNFSFCNNFDSYILSVSKRSQIDCIINMIKLDKLETYLSFDNIDISIFFSHIKSQYFKVKMLEYIINLNEDKVTIEKKNNLIKILCNYYLDEAHYPMIKFMLQNTYIQQNYFSFKTLDNWLVYLVSIAVDRYGSYHDNVIKSKIIREIFLYIQKDTCIWESLIIEIKTANYRWVDYGESILSYLIKLPKIIPVLDMISNSSNSNSYLLLDNINNRDEFFCSLLRYGTYETYRYLEPDFIKYLISNISNLDFYICYCLCNKDIRILRDFMQIWEHKFNIQFHELDINFRFIDLPKLSLDQKKKRLKLLSKYINKEYIRTKLNKDLYFYYNYTNEIEFYYWYLGKFYQNIIMPTLVSQDEFESIFKIIINTQNFDLINYLLKITVYFYDFNPIFEMILSFGYSWFDDITQKVLKRCQPLKNMNDSQKSSILDKLNYSRNNLNFETWDKIVKILIEAEFKIKKSNSEGRWYSIDHRCAYLISTIKNDKNSFAIALLANGIPFQPVKDYFENYPQYVSHYDPIKCWISLYTVIKRLQFRITFRRKKIHCKEFRSTIIDLKSRPPLIQKDKPVLQKGGLLYYRDLDEIEGLYGNSSVEFQKPIHVEPLELISWLRNPGGIFSQKADGYLVKGVDIDTLYPNFPSTYEFRQLDAEYIDSLDIYLVFQIRSHVNYHSSYLEDYRELVNEHPFAKSYSITDSVILESDTEYKIRDKLEKEFLKIKDFITKSRLQKKKGKLWWPKTVYNFSFHNPTKKLEILQIIEDFQRHKFIQLKNMVVEEELIYLPTDGLILMDNVNKTRILKLKPKFQMTADLQYEKAIWRMEWDYLQNKWIPMEKRIDKTHPNPPILVRKLEKYHRNPWLISDIKPFLETTLYYQNQHSKIITKDNYSQEFITQFRNITSFYIQKWVSKSNKKPSNIDSSNLVLDLGCGFGEKTLWKNKEVEIHGLDVEPQIWLDEKVTCRKHKKFYHDISKSWHKSLYLKNSVVKYYDFIGSNFMIFSSDNNKLETKYDYITSFMSLHNVYSNPEGIKNLLDGIQNKITSKSKFIISFLDRDMLFPDNILNSTDKISLSSGSFIQYLGNNKIKYFYNWRHYEPQIEYCLSQNELEIDLEKYGWKLELMNKNINHNNLSINKKNVRNPWFRVLNSLKLVCFSRIE